MRNRLAPSARRTFDSCSRATARTSSRLATFTDVISTIRSDAPSSASRDELKFRARSSRNGVTTGRMLALDAGYCFDSAAAITSSSAWAE